MKKQEFANRVAEKFNELNQGDVLEILDAMTEVVIESLKDVEDKEPIPVLPKALKVYKRWTPAKPEREGVNPQNGEKITIKAKPAAWSIKAGVLKRLREADVGTADG